MTIIEATSAQEWDQFLTRQQFRPFLQSWTMGEVYRRIGQEPVRLMTGDVGGSSGICFAHVINAKRGRHLSIPYGPVIDWKIGGEKRRETAMLFLAELKKIAKGCRCSFIRLSPFWPKSEGSDATLRAMQTIHAPLHLLAEHLWYLPLTESDLWSSSSISCSGMPITDGRRQPSAAPRSEEELMKSMRSTTRNLVRRAEKEGVTVTASDDPVRDLPVFLQLHEETRKRHRFTPYTDAFFLAQIEEFAKTGHSAPAGGNVILYTARHNGKVIASSVHMTFGGETSYHHGASVMSKIPASYLLQWTAIRDALKRGDHVYNFWGIAPCGMENTKHPFSGVTLFKTGFGGKSMELTHCRDIPLSPKYYVTRGLEVMRKWHRGF
ncbi:peptidoglycan bridge formation glycyltransferase FemA/FemB family protein [Candidatus Peregrinibacteria bacterium]|nr:peptidoglycan bridge formation glycyltransferase FemA/FemB family protein [Candidatus Peregrinibacteria bacterium]